MDTARLEKFAGQMVQDLGAAIGAPLVLLGERLGLYRAMAGSGGLTPEELAAKTSTDARYVREWLCAQAASGYVTFDPTTNRFTLPEEHAAVLADEKSPAFMLGGFEVLESLFKDLATVSSAYQSGRGVGWHEHDACLFRGTERFFRVGYATYLTQQWIPALEGVEAKLNQGGTIGDVGCGHGASTIVMAKAYPNCEVIGFDYHPGSIETARARAHEAGVADRVRFEVASAKSFPGKNFDLICFFDCLHDMGDPVGAAAHVRQALAPDGTWMIVEPFAGDRIEDNLNPVGRVFYAASSFICTPASRSQEIGLALGAQAGEARLRDVVTAGGFTGFRRATETAFNLILEARP